MDSHEGACGYLAVDIDIDTTEQASLICFECPKTGSQLLKGFMSHADSNNKRKGMHNNRKMLKTIKQPQLFKHPTLIMSIRMEQCLLCSEFASHNAIFTLAAYLDPRDSVDIHARGNNLPSVAASQNGQIYMY